MSNFEIYNNNAELIISDTFIHSGQIKREPTKATVRWYNIDSTGLNAPSFIDKLLYAPVFDKLAGEIPMGLLKFNEGGCICGNEYYSVDCGTISWCNREYSIESGYLDVYNEFGDIVWSAKSASKVPRITQVINLTASQIRDGARIYIGNQWLMLNNLPSVMLPAPAGRLTAGGLYMKWSNGWLDVQFKLASNTSTTTEYLTQLWGQYGLNIYLCTFI